MKNKKLITLLMSFLTTLGLVSCGAIDFKENISNQPIETFIEPNIESHGMKVNRLSTGIDANDHEYQTFSFVVLPSNSYYREVTASITFADDRQNPSQYLTATVDNDNSICTVTMIQLFDSVATLKLTTANQNVFSDITIRLNPRYSFSCSLAAIDSDYHETETVSGVTINCLDFKSHFLSESQISMLTNTEVLSNPYSSSLPAFSGTPSISLNDFVENSNNNDSDPYVRYPWFQYIRLVNSGISNNGSFRHEGMDWVCFCLLKYFNSSFDSNFNSTSDFFDESYLSSNMNDWYLNYKSPNHNSSLTHVPPSIAVRITNSIQSYCRDNNGKLRFCIELEKLPFSFTFSGVSFIEKSFGPANFYVDVDVWNPSLTITPESGAIEF